MKVVWAPEAEADRLAIIEYIANEDPGAAAHMDQLFSDAAAMLARFPMRGRPGAIVGTRELVPHGSYRLIYEIEGETVWVLTVVHAARQWPPVQD